MTEQTFYILNEDELMKINDLCECLGIAIDKIIRGRQLVGTDGELVAVERRVRCGRPTGIQDQQDPGSEQHRHQALDQMRRHGPHD